jgi:hypothetical protein
MNKRDRIIHLIREMMVANTPGTGGGFSSITPRPDTTAGFDPIMGGMFRRTKRGKVDGRTVSKVYARWLRSMGEML